MKQGSESQTTRHIDSNALLELEGDPREVEVPLPTTVRNLEIRKRVDQVYSKPTGD